LFTNRGEGVFDDLATGLQSGAISRRKAIKLAGAALVATALGAVFRSQDAQAADLEDARRPCKTLSCLGKCRRCKRLHQCCRACHRCRRSRVPRV
jgi:hypothetical protein